MWSLIHCCFLHWIYITGYYRVVHVSHLFHISHYRRVCLFINFGHNKIGFYLFYSWHSNKVQKPLRHMQRSSERGMWEEQWPKEGGGAEMKWMYGMSLGTVERAADRQRYATAGSATDPRPRARSRAATFLLPNPFLPFISPLSLSCCVFVSLSLDSRVLALPVIPKGVIILYAGAVACFCCRCQWLRHRLLRLQHSTARGLGFKGEVWLADGDWK